MRERVPTIASAESAAAVLEGADGAVVVTGWDEFATFDAEFDVMDSPVIVDGRRIVEPSDEIVSDGLTW